MTGIYAAINLASCPYWNLMRHYNTLDMGLAFWMEATLHALLLAQRVQITATSRARWMCMSWASMALAVLSKELIGVILPGAVLILYSVLAGLVGAAYIGRLSSANTPRELYRAFQVWVYVALLVSIALTAAAFLRLRSRPESKLAATLCFGFRWLLLATIAGNGHEVISRESTGIALVPTVKAAMKQLPAETPFYSITKPDHTMPYYLGHTTITVQGADELRFGVDAESQKFVSTIDEWTRRWGAAPTDSR
jgi:4-amino-4-deoxy-L-arabinose transferase-like glycosyltransferase